MKALALAVLVAAFVAPSALAKDRTLANYCSESGDVCTGISVRSGSLLLEISTFAHYFDRYSLCVRGPKSKVCKTFAVKPTGEGDFYGSRVRWRDNFPYQGPGAYKVTWQYSGKTLSFRLPL